MKALDFIIEKLSDLEHRQWAHWTQYMLNTLEKEASEGIPFNQLPSVKHWRRQIDTPYESLSEKEKDSDREWAYKMFKVIETTLDLLYFTQLKTQATARLKSLSNEKGLVNVFVEDGHGGMLLDQDSSFLKAILKILYKKAKELG